MFETICFDLSLLMKFILFFCYRNLIIFYIFRFTSRSSEVIYHLDLPLFVYCGSYSLPFLYWRRARRLYFGSPSFSIVINDLCAEIYNSNFVLFADYLKIYHEIFYWRLYIFCYMILNCYRRGITKTVWKLTYIQLKLFLSKCVHYD
jgi:hypothetical protein